MEMQDFWHRTAKSGTWAGYYDRDADLKTYNFFTRRDGVMKLLEGDGTYERILDVGCGSGDYFCVAERHSGQFFGIDYAPAMIREAVERFPGHGKEHLYLVGSGTELPYRDNTFDLAIALGYIEYFREPSVPMRELQRVIKPGGTLIMQSYKKDLFGELDRFVLEPMKNVAKAVLGRKGNKADLGLPPDWYDKKYSKRQLDSLVRDYGFERTDYLFNNFHVYPAHWMLRRPRRYIEISERISHKNPKSWGCLAVNYIAKYTLHKDAPVAEQPEREGVAC